MHAIMYSPLAMDPHSVLSVPLSVEREALEEAYQKRIREYNKSHVESPQCEDRCRESAAISPSLPKLDDSKNIGANPKKLPNDMFDLVTSIRLSCESVERRCEALENENAKLRPQSEEMGRRNEEIQICREEVRRQHEEMSPQLEALKRQTWMFALVLEEMKRKDVELRRDIEELEQEAVEKGRQLEEWKCQDAESFHEIQEGIDLLKQVLQQRQLWNGGGEDTVDKDEGM